MTKFISLKGIKTFQGNRAINLKELHQLVTKNKKIKIKSTNARSLKEDKLAYTKAKLELPAVMLGVAQTTGLRTSDIGLMSPYVQIDIDDVPKDDVKSVVRTLADMEYVQYVFETGTGVTGVAVIDRSLDPLTTQAGRGEAREVNAVIAHRIESELADLNITAGVDASVYKLNSKCYIWHDAEAVLKADGDIQPLELTPEDRSAYEEHQKEKAEKCNTSKPPKTSDTYRPDLPQEILDEALTHHNPDAGRNEGWMQTCLAYTEPSLQLGTDEANIKEHLEAWSATSNTKFDDETSTNIDGFIRTAKGNLHSPKPKSGLGSLLQLALQEPKFRAKVNRYRALDMLPAVDDTAREFDTYSAMKADKVQPVKPVIDGLIGVGEKLMLSAASKFGKTWTLLDLAKVASEGGEWFEFKVPKMKVVLLNFEFTRERLHERLSRIGGLNDNVLIDHLKGHTLTAEQLVERLKEMLEKVDDVGLIIIDPIYKLLGNLDENDNTQVGQLLNTLGELAKASGAAIVFSHHFSKGSKSGTSQIDKASGAGAWARDPDAIVTLSQHEKEDVAIFEATVRNYSAPKPSTWRRDFPKWTKADEDPKKSGKRGGSNASMKISDVVDYLKEVGDKVKLSDAAKHLAAQYDCTDKTARKYISSALYAEEITEIDGHLLIQPDGVLPSL